MTLKETVAQRQARAVEPPVEGSESAGFDWLAWPGRIAILLAVLSAPWMIGSVGFHAQWILAILLAIATGSWWLVLVLSRDRNPILPWVAFFLLAGVLLGLFQTMPLSGSLASSLLGRQLEIHQEWGATALQGEKPVPTVSLDTDATWRQLLLLVLSLAAFSSASGLFRRGPDLVLLWAACSINGAALAFFGILQKLTFNGKLFWQLELTQGGTPFASFVNRNNGAGFLLLCFAANLALVNWLWLREQSRVPELLISREIPFWRQVSTWIQIQLADLTATKLASLISVVLIGAGIMASLSRGGVIALLGGSIFGLLYYGMARRPQAGGMILLPMMLAIMLLTAWVGFYDELMERFQPRDLAADTLVDAGRWKTWTTTIQSFPALGWLGAGLGSYPLVHRMYCQDPETVIFQYAENQWVQSLVDAGLPGILLLSGAVFLAFWCSQYLLYRGTSAITVATGSLGILLAGTQVLASAFDFGWYVGANAVVLSVLMGTVCCQAHALAQRLKKKSVLRFALPLLLVRGFTLVVFSGTVLAAVLLHRYSTWDRMVLKNVVELPPGKLDEPATRDHLEHMTRLHRQLGNNRSSEAAYLGDLWLRMARLSFYRQMNEALPTAGLSAERREKILDNQWSLTSLERMLEHSRFLNFKSGSSSSSEFLSAGFARDCLPLAARFWTDSTRHRPLSPEIQTRLGLVNLIRGNDATAQKLLASTAQMVPGSATQHRLAAQSLLASGYPDLAAVRFQKQLQLEPSSFQRTVVLIKGISGRMARPMDNTRIVREVLPADPELLYAFSGSYLADEPELKEELLKRALELLVDTPLSNHARIVLKANVHLARGDLESGIDSLRTALTSGPNEKAVRQLLAEKLLEANQPREAEEHARRLLEESPRWGPYEELWQRAREKLEESKMKESRNGPSG